MPDRTYKVGDLVRLNGVGPTMVVLETDDYQLSALCLVKPCALCRRVGDEPPGKCKWYYCSDLEPAKEVGRGQ